MEGSGKPPTSLDDSLVVVWAGEGPRGVEESDQFGRGRGRKREGHVFVHIASTLVH